MARVKLSEYRAKSLLVPEYAGRALYIASLKADTASLSASTRYIVKVDQGIKKRGKQGLVVPDVAKDDVAAAARNLAKHGFERFIAEPMLPHADSEEQYVSFERTRSGMTILYSKHGGVAVEDHPESVESYTQKNVPLPKNFVQHIIDIMNHEHLSFVEINPLIIRGDTGILLDAAVLADSAGMYRASWSDEDIVDAHHASASEQVVAQMNRNSPAAFTFRVLNPDGAIWLLLSGGGASITIADEAAGAGKASLIGNYGEYSGGPTTEEAYLYTQAVLSALLASQAPRKALVIAGGVANFTDVATTFRGVIKALDEVAVALRKADVRVFVRRGGPHEKEGLAIMADFLTSHDLYGSIHGSDTVLTDVIHEALETVNA
ncbi:MAG TPA: ATP citrate lyase citrate-binding domain-containing protein [Candidatus Saccharimonadaceae bacterium]|nr:ATP citrate lyase citrate-binding domain-containing protein [Candidatus Saccharimonadaceae bacterium]